MNPPVAESHSVSAAAEPRPSLMKRLRERLRNRPDSEHEMTPNRLVFAGSVILYLLVASWLGSEDAYTMLLGTTEAFAIYFVVALAIFAHIVWKPGVSKVRRLVAMVADFAMMSFAAIEGGIASGLFYPFYLWTIFGNGFRFGIPYLFAAMLVGNIGFLSVIVGTGIWRDHLGLSIALSLCLVMLPLYAGKLIKKLSEAKEQAEQANRAKGAFLASVSHELRTPLNAVIGLGDLLRSQIRDPEQRHMVQTIVDAGKTLLNRINSILDFSRIEAGKMPTNIADIDFYREMRRVESMLSVQAEAKSIAFNIHIAARTPRYLRCDFGHIEQVLLNLGANAIKFTSQGHVIVTVDAVNKEGAAPRLRFEVADTGIGIAPAAQARIFDAFSQADSSILDRFGGTGLGLAISKQLVMLMNGDIGIESEPGKGSTFWFEIDTTLSSSAEESTPVHIDPITVFTRDAGLSLAIRALGHAPVEIPSAEQLLDAMRANADNALAAVVVLDQTAIEPEELDDVLSTLHTSGARIIAVAAEECPVPVAVRRDCVASVGRPVQVQDLRNALDLAAIKSSAQADDALLVPQIGRGRSLSILVAEDNGTNQMVIAKILERAGHRATIVGNGQAALDSLREDSFDLVLMDVNMPVLNGIEATKLHRFATVGMPQVPIVALTADATSEAVARCAEAGMNAYATKPIEPAKLIEIIEQVMAESGAEVPAKNAPMPEEYRAADSDESDVVDSNKIEDLENLGGRRFVAELAAQFASDSERLLDQLRIASATGDVHGFRDTLHALRSCAANVGATGVFRTCLALRAIAEQEFAVESERKISGLEDEVQRALNALSLYVARNEAGDEAGEDDLPLRAAG